MTAADLASQARVRVTTRALRRLFSVRPAGLLTDVDGTISRITQRTGDATVLPTARRSLTRLAGHLELVGVITGRAVPRAQHMVGVDGITYVGNHGLEWLHEGTVQTDPAAVAARPALQAAMDAIRHAVSDPGLTYEDKGVSVAVHYRQAADPEQAGRLVLAALEPHLHGGQIRLIQGGLVVNLLPNLAIDKGEAARRLVAQHGLQSVAFFGDDVTDLDAFRAIHALQADSAVQALAIGVTSLEGPPQIRAEADLLLDGVGEVERVLAALARRPPSSQASNGSSQDA
ncbi:MAG: trehalose-phosphatase [Chloroflexota bacterium]